MDTEKVLAIVKRLKSAKLAARETYSHLTVVADKQAQMIQILEKELEEAMMGEIATFPTQPLTHPL